MWEGHYMRDLSCELCTNPFIMSLNAKTRIQNQYLLVFESFTNIQWVFVSCMKGWVIRELIQNERKCCERTRPTYGEWATGVDASLCANMKELLSLRQFLWVITKMVEPAIMLLLMPTPSYWHEHNSPTKTGCSMFYSRGKFNAASDYTSFKSLFSSSIRILYFTWNLVVFLLFWVFSLQMWLISISYISISINFINSQFNTKKKTMYCSSSFSCKQNKNKSFCEIEKRIFYSSVYVSHGRAKVFTPGTLCILLRACFAFKFLSLQRFVAFL